MSGGPRDLRCRHIDDDGTERQDEVVGGEVDVDPEISATDRDDRQLRDRGVDDHRPGARSNRTA